MGPAVNRSRLSPEYLKNIYTTSASKKPDPPSAMRESGINYRVGRDSANISEEARQMQRVEQSKNIYGSSIDQQKNINRPGPDQRKVDDQENLEKQRENRVSEQKEIFERFRIKEDQQLDEKEELERAKENEELTKADDDRKPEIPVPETAEKVQENLRDDTAPTAGVDNANNSEIIQAYASAANFTQASITVNYKL